MTKLVIATGNQNKAKEYREMLPTELGVDVATLKDLENVPDIIENGTTFAQNARIKATTIMEHFNLLVLADDSGLMVEALNGEPGVHSARYAGDHDDKANREKLLNKLNDVSNRSATFHTTIYAIKPDGNVLEVAGEVKGQIVEAPRGSEAFGYDCLFQPDGESRTFGEMTGEEKDAISHRGRAMRKFLESFDQWWQN
ncbi:MULTISPECIES: RdgB/HAM1 family non-canonical purine NTP pyrophosphatase [Furfurilactobacillus]|uniref:dITP/XTP pyrophosphatase n=1 Tax=Furfurilactobacillus milii TaxID=2888272 RepID=A0ABT6DC36_9LACO|nr:RdgB/HAM1 family non-canonical purine NTP pyrophosphatase [Furfurilactobacillus milii]QLE65602.1 Nucleoside 5-triphosphatase RdgB dHAPTP dITP XTP-specific [Furfurilactobacillus rossiae]MCF6161824.1 RdgB/HAM1 family non-canonical purine NTP pyrophosphatase [Furfurilactobacillus milii]MCF6164164.1 RdgB/HAM1 family non-canonical purine NTP pyrophosphatase [Furfurilactobacillus milii]MDF9914707.1 RdgB/HAM1 family non-canonical purine NTP pyrophosphatase [Furfurilactobacillus milii]QLE68032.1 Nu